MWHTHLEVSDLTDMLYFECKSDGTWCAKVSDYLKTEFQKVFINFKHEHGFDQPTAMR